MAANKFSIVIIMCLHLMGLVSSNPCKSDICNSGPIPIEEYIREHGYPVEAHDITTADGYILTYHRIPHGRHGPDHRTRKPVLLQHGLLASSAAWVLTSQALGYLIADSGFDLWLGNARGNTYSRKHTIYDPDRDKRAFWSFSWHEMGHYDLPASIDYILNVTGHRELFYIGHSMGTTMFFVLGATRPEYMTKIEAAVLMAPVAYPYNIRSPLANLVNKMQPFLDKILKSLNIYELLPQSRDTFWLDERLCSNKIFQFICKDIIFEIAGFDSSELNMTALPVDLNFLPAGTSVKIMQHFSQISKKDAQFRQFDYGFMGNMWRYQSSTPPMYNMTKIKVPVYVHYAENDWLAVPQDVVFTAQHLPNVKSVRKVPYHLFNHLDFMWSIDGRELVYNSIIKNLQTHSSSKEH